MSAKRWVVLALAVILTLALTGCRTRTGAGSGDATGAPEDNRPGQAASVTTEPGEAEASAEAAEAGGRTRENPDADRREYDENAPAEIRPGTDHLLHAEGEGDGRPGEDPEADLAADRLREDAADPATRTVAAPDAEQMAVSEDGEMADSAMTYFTVLLQDRMGSLFECKRVNVYWETAADRVTIHRTAPEHALILGAGAYDVSARLLPENLRVDDGWVVRKNPQVIVKIVDGRVLGRSASGTGAAAAVRRSLLSREGWGGIDAVRQGKVVLLSEELLDAPWLQTAAMLLVAKAAYPSEMADVDPEEALRMLAEEATGTALTGVYFDLGGSD